MRLGVVVTLAFLKTVMSDLPDPQVFESGAVVRLYLCRHGQTDYNAQGRIQGSSVDRPLTDTGIQQAERVAEALRDVPLDLVGSSPLARAVQTADAIAKKHPAANRVEHSDLREMNFGDFEGKQLDSLKDGYKHVNDAWANGDVDKKWPGGGESPVDVASRARKALRDLGCLVGGDHGVRHVALVTHGRFNKIILADLLGMGLHQCGTIQQDNCCINVIDIDPTAQIDATDACRQVALNIVDHLQD